MEKDELKIVFKSLTDLENKVYEALIKSIFSGDEDGGQTDLRDTLKFSQIKSNQFSGVLSSLAKKGLYENVLWDGGFGLPYKTIFSKGFKINVRTDIGYVVCSEEVTPHLFVN